MCIPLYLDRSSKLVHTYIKLCPLQVKLLKEKLGFDDAFNYKTEPDLSIALKRFVIIEFSNSQYSSNVMACNFLKSIYI